MKIKTFTKIISGILCAALTMQIGLGVTLERVNAADEPSITAIGDTSSGITVTMSGDYAFNIKQNANGYSLTCTNHSEVDKIVPQIDKLVLDNVATTFLNTDLTTELEMKGSDPHFTIKNGATFTCTGLSGNGWIQNSGIMRIGTYKSSDYPDMCISNNNVLYADTLDFSDMTNPDFIENTYASPSCSYYVTHSFYNSQYTLQGTVVAEPDTIISSEGGKFNLKVGNITKEITGTFVNVYPEYLFKSDLNISLGQVPNVFYGTTYDFTNYISCESDYTGNIQLQYSDDDINFQSSAPTSVGKHYVRAIAEETDDYKSATSASRSFNIDYLPNSEVNPEGEYFTLGNVVDGKYVNGTVTIIPVSEYQILCSHATVPNAFFDSISLSEDQLYSNGSINTQVYFVFKRTGDDAETKEIYATSISTPNISDLVFDTSAPHFDAAIVDETGEPINETSVDDENVVIVADHLFVSVWDDTLKTVTVDINGTTTDYSNQISEEGYCEITFDGKALTAQKVKISATDIFEKKSTAEFTLYHEPIETTISLSVPGTIYAGDDYKVTTNTNSDGNVTLQYKDAGTGEILTSKPTDAGSYTVTATAAETDFYSEANDSKNYTIIKRTPVNTLSVPDVTYSGDYYNVEFKTDSDGEVTYQYYDKNNDSYLDTKPTSAGEYIVTVTTAETAKYYRSEKTATIKIIKRTADTTAIAPEVVYVGDDYDVTVDTTSNGNAYYQYYDKNNGSYLDGKPTSAGEYTVTVTVSETSLYYESEDTATFKIIKRDPTISLSVPDSIVGQTYTPVLETDSDSKAITYEYKVEGAADSTYTKTKPTAAGSYTARVTIGSTNKFNEGSDTADFKISKKTPSVSLGVGTPYAGTTYTPSFTSNSDAASRAVFEYKEKNADDSKYSKTAPNKVGTYVVRVTIPETDTFAKATATTDFRIIYLDAPQTAYLIEGQSGKNNFYVSDVVLKAPTGYSISAVYGGTYTPSIPYKDGITSVYLKRTSDGALTNAIPIANAPRVDKSAPSISTPNGTIAQGAVMYVSDFTLNISDPNLRSLKVNGEAVDLTNYKDGYTLTLSPGLGSETYKVMAEDEAGNVTTLEFTLKAEWLQDKVIIPDVVLPLEGNESYNLGEGYWLVTRNTPEGPVTDDTVYSGNMPFYVNESGDYTFTKINQ